MLKHLSPLLLLSLFLPTHSSAIEDPSAVTKTASIVENLGTKADLNLHFQDSEETKPKSLKNLLSGKRPVIITPVYYRCPRLCSLVLNGFVDALNKIDLKVGRDFDILTVSFDPKETSELASQKRKTYLATLKEEDFDRQGWKFLSGTAENISGLMKDLGFGYTADKDEFIHSAAIMILSPNGVITRYLYGIEFNPKILRLSLIEASKGKIGNTLDRVLLYCFRFDPTKGKYTPAVMNIVRAISLSVVAVLGVAIVGMRRREKQEADKC